MTTTRHTPISTSPKTIANAATFNAPLSQLDSAIVAEGNKADLLLSSMGAGTGWASTLDGTASSGQKVVPVASTTGAVAGMPVYIGLTSGTHEVGVIDTISAGVSVTLKVNLGATYAAGTPISATPAEVADARGGYATLGEKVRAQGFDLRDYGGKIDGVTDDSAAWVAACAAASAAGGGLVTMPRGTTLITSNITIPSGVSVWGVGSLDATLGSVILCGSADAGITFGTVGTGIPTYHGTSGNFAVNGNFVATQPLLVGLAFGTWETISAANGAAGGSNITIKETQNCIFLNVQSMWGAGDMLTLDGGAGNNLFVKCEFNSLTASGGHPLVIEESYSPPAFLFGRPTKNTFSQCVFESTSAEGAVNVAMVVQTEGDQNVFRDCTFSNATAPASAGDPLVVLTSVSTVYCSTTFDNCTWQGDAARGWTALKADVYSIVSVITPTLGYLAKAWDNANILSVVGPTSDLSLSVTTWATNPVLVREIVNPEIDYAENAFQVSVVATSEATAGTIITSNSLTYHGAPIDIEFCSPNVSGPAYFFFYLFDGATSLGSIGYLVSATSEGPLTLKRRLTPSPGAHTYSVRASVSTGTGIVGGGPGGAGEVLPMRLRISRT